MGGSSIVGGDTIEVSGKGPGQFGRKKVITLHKYEKGGEILGHFRRIKLIKGADVRA